MVGAVQIQVTIDAALVVDESHRGGVGGLGGRGAVRRGMTLLTQARARNLEQLLLVAPVRIVTIGAVLDDGRMLVQERTTLLSVAGVARLVHGARDQQLLVGRSVRVVA